MITELLNTVSEFTKSSPVVGAAMAGAITMAVSGLVIYIMRDIPSKIYRGVVDFMFTKLTIDNSEHMNKETFNSLAIIISNNVIPLLSRTISESSYYKHEVNESFIIRDVSIGYGSHLFRFGGKLMLARRIKIDAGTNPYDSLRVISFGFSKTILKELLGSAKHVSSGKVSVMYLNDSWWSNGGAITGYGMNRLILEPETKALLTTHIDHFIDSYKNGLNNVSKLTFLLHGEPGGGKTGLIRALANEYDRTVYCLELSGLNDVTLRGAVSKIPKGSILLIEDCDCISATTTRNSNVSNEPVLTLAGVLNALDGIVPLDDVITFMTTNHVESLDEALIRSARVDVKIELPLVSKTTIEKHIKDNYGIDLVVESDMKGSDIYELLRTEVYTTQRVV